MSRVIKLFLKSTLLLSISTDVGKVDLYGIFMPSYKYMYLVKKMKGVPIKIHYQYRYIKRTKLLVASVKSIVLC